MSDQTPPSAPNAPQNCPREYQDDYIGQQSPKLGAPLIIALMIAGIIGAAYAVMYFG
ncbi:hypothetical protein [Asticcacaulis endophyticus]|uniref:Uncharacterized protein n=1 Tax=Asticcacaulis endophyticus TaxID=1395890 RepID=A0A918QHK5_9CAUL|nr:hypothetical protein [Asticcacaulis endophyticus]GGZ46045.1 hypothetical protein GCM10011273_35870 [Asticcacaulis endophyticus]